MHKAESTEGQVGRLDRTRFQTRTFRRRRWNEAALAAGPPGRFWCIHRGVCDFFFSGAHDAVWHHRMLSYGIYPELCFRCRSAGNPVCNCPRFELHEHAGLWNHLGSDSDLSERYPVSGHRYNETDCDHNLVERKLHTTYDMDGMWKSMQRSGECSECAGNL